MDANNLLFYLRGFAEHVPQPSEAQWHALRSAILSAKPVKTGCGCGGKDKPPIILETPRQQPFPG